MLLYVSGFFFSASVFLFAYNQMFFLQEMMYIWNGYTVIGKHKDLTEGMLKTLDEAQQKLEQNPSTVSDQPNA